MHTYTSPNGVRFHYNPDSSGEVIISAPGKPEFAVKMDDLMDFFWNRDVVAEIWEFVPPSPDDNLPDQAYRVEC